MELELNHVGPCTRSKRKAQTALVETKKPNDGMPKESKGNKRRKLNNKQIPEQNKIPVVVLPPLDENYNGILGNKISKSLSSSEEDFQDSPPMKVKARPIQTRKTPIKKDQPGKDLKTKAVKINEEVPNPKVANTLKICKDAESSESESEWEDVTDHEEDDDEGKKEKEPCVQENGVEITLEVPETLGMRRRKMKEFDIQDFFRLRLNRYKKEVQLNMHKVHLLCLLTRGMFLSQMILDDEVKATLFSTIPLKHLEEKSRPNKKSLTKMLAWFSKQFSIDNKFCCNEGILAKDHILQQITEKVTHNKDHFCAILAVALRLAGFECRIVFSLQPVCLKPPDLKPKQPRPDKKTPSKSSKSKSNCRKLVSSNSDSDLDFKEPRIKAKGSVSGQKKPAPEGASEGDDVWLEAYFDDKEGWVTINPFACLLVGALEMERNATQPIRYVVAFNVDGHARDVTMRYASEWLSTTRKLRVSGDWWKETLQLPLLKGHQTERDNKEDQKLQQNIEDAPVPTTISMIKNHPLYVLQRHLLKFQAIYPSESVPVAYIRGEAVYSRHCVHTLHSRETWLKDARMVRIGQTPYKVVKARPKWNKNLQALETDLPLELFGHWQTEDYVPLPVKDGKIPRNEFGNVELFKPCMLPPGAVHVQDTPGLNKVARQLGVDCAAAMVGWDYHAGGSHPLFDGWVICEGDKDMLLDAWKEDQEIALQRRKEKREKEIYGNWRRLIRGLLIRERLRTQHGSDSSTKSTAT